MKVTVNMRRFGGFLLALCLCIGAASAAGETPRRYQPLSWEWKKEEIKELKEMAEKVAANSDGSFSLETENWQVRTWHTPLFTAQAGKYMELFSEVFFKAFMLKGERGFSGFKPELNIYANRAMYMQKSGGPSWSAGLCKTRWSSSGGTVTPEITLHAFYEYDAHKNGKEPVFGTKVPLGTIQHEGAHCLLQCIYGPMKIPVWLNEGAASYYEAWLLREKISDDGESKKDIAARAKRRGYSPAIRSLKAQLRGKDTEMPRLDRLVLANTHAQFYVDNGGPLTNLNYDLAESFIDFLMSSRKRRPFMLQVLERVKDYKGEATVEKPFITPEEALEYEKEWLMFLEKNWGCKFNVEKIKERVQELKNRVKISE